MTKEELIDLARSLGELYFDDDPASYAVYYKDDAGAEETLLSGTTDPVTRDAIRFVVEAQKFILALPTEALALPARYDMQAHIEGDPEMYGGPVWEANYSKTGEWVKWEDVKHLFAPSPQREKP